MNNLYVEFRDPLFGVIVFFVLVFVIAFFSYWWGRFKSKEQQRHLEAMMAQFHTLPTSEELSALMANRHIPQKSWLLLAQAYILNGDYERAIEIYQSLSEHQRDPKERLETLFLLGHTYFKAGFLERSKSIFLQILKRQPRSPKALHFLLMVYEQLKDYDKALEVLEPLDELGEEGHCERYYLECAALLQNPKRTPKEKCTKLIAFYELHPTLSYMVFEYLFRHDAALAWKHLDQSVVERISDILWHLNEDQLDLDIIAKNRYLRELYSAKGVVVLAEGSSVFELDVLIRLQKGHNATLQFEYLCRECKHLFPFAFHRCPNCYAIDSVTSEPLLAKETREENFAFQ